jgi:RNA polymerase sigma-70 factor (ECF subfamily)
MTGDEEIVAGLRRGRPGAFDAAYGRYRARIYAFLVRLSGDRALAEDLLQECWLRLARHAAELDEDTRLGPWLYTVARNLFLSHRRWALLDLERLAELRLWRAVRAEPASPFEHLAAGETERRLESAIAALPLPYREVLLLVAVERLEPADAAAVLGLTAEALRQRLARARAMIAKTLASFAEQNASNRPTARASHATEDSTDD